MGWGTVNPDARVAFPGKTGLRVQLGPLGPTLTSSQAASTPDRAAHLAIQAVERQLERLVAVQRGEPTYGVPSRRRPGAVRGHGEGTEHDAPSSAADS